MVSTKVHKTISVSFKGLPFAHPTITYRDGRWYECLQLVSRGTFITKAEVEGVEATCRRNGSTVSVSHVLGFTQACSG